MSADGKFIRVISSREKGGRGSPASDEHMMETVKTNETTYTATDALQRRPTNLYQDGVLVLQPAASPDPKDPINMPLRRKIIGLTALCFFGALAAAAELILGAMLPVFALVYAGIDPKFLVPLTKHGGFPLHSNPLSYLQKLPGAYPITDVYLLASMPILIIGLANLFLIPMAVAVGRRPVVLASGVIAVAGAVWAGHSRSLGEHIGARCVQAIGAGTVESLIPFIIQDMVHVHERNKWISAVFTMQGLILVVLGVASPYMIINLDWRWIYFITAIMASFFLVGVFFFMPETRWPRTKAEMDGIPRVDPPGTFYTERNFAYDIALFRGKAEWKKGLTTLWITCKTFFYPNIFFVTILNSAMIATALAAGYTVAPALLTAPWSWDFHLLGLCLIPLVISAVAVMILSGWLADWFANYMAKKNGTRVPEVQIINLIAPCIASIVGTVLYGLAGANQDRYHWAVFLFGLGLMAFGFLGANAVGAVYVLECYPHLTGTALMNIASLRMLIAFILSFRVAEWISDWGYFVTMMIYLGIMCGFTLLLPVVYKWGGVWRSKWNH